MAQIGADATRAAMAHDPSSRTLEKSYLKPVEIMDLVGAMTGEEITSSREMLMRQAPGLVR